MFKTILVPVDLWHIEKGSDMIERAKYLADTGNSQAHAAQCCSGSPVIRDERTSHRICTNARVESATADLQAVVRKHDLPTSTRIVVKSGNPARVILDHAEEGKFDLIMVASHQPGLRDYLLGSVAGKIVRHARCPVLVLR